MCMAIKLQGWTDGVTCNHAWAIVKREAFPAAILNFGNMNFYMRCWVTLEERNQAINNIETINQFLAKSNCSDFMIQYYKGGNLCLIGSFDLCYYSQIEIIFEEVCYISMHTYFALWDLKNNPFKVKFAIDDVDCKLEIQIGEDMEGKTHTIGCENFRVHIVTQDVKKK